MVDVVKMARMGLIAAPRRLGIRGFARMLQVSTEWEHLQKLEPSHHWYLMILGVVPADQGRGIGGALMQPVLEEADREGVPCYLETMTVKTELLRFPYNPNAYPALFFVGLSPLM